jgi:hypothetical protein
MPQVGVANVSPPTNRAEAAPVATEKQKSIRAFKETVSQDWDELKVLWMDRAYFADEISESF